MEPTRPHAKYFFLHLGIIALLYTVISSFLTFAFDIINYVFPDRQAYAFDPYSTSMRTALSVLIVAFPVLVYLSRVVHKELIAHPEDRAIPVRRWLSYLTLFFSGAALIIDLIVLINTFLNGEISTRFFVKFAVVGAVAFAVFWYTVRDLKGVYFERPQLLKLFTIIVSAVILLSIVGGFMIMGSPAKQRMLRDDMDRVNDLSSLQWSVLSYYQRTGELPASTEDLRDDFNSGWQDGQFNDPVTKEPYEYSRVTGTTSISFELCANFDLATEDLEGRGEYGRGGGWSSTYDSTVYPYPGGGFDTTFKHTEGRNCFTKTIDPKLYPVYKQEGVI